MKKNYIDITKRISGDLRKTAPGHPRHHEGLLGAGAGSWP